MLFKHDISVLICFCLDDLSLVVSGVFWFPGISVFCQFFPLLLLVMSVYFGTLWLRAYVLIRFISSCCSVPFIVRKSAPVSHYLFDPEVYFIRYNYGYTCFFLGSIYLENHFAHFLFECPCSYDVNFQDSHCSLKKLKKKVAKYSDGSLINSEKNQETSWISYQRGWNF